MPYPLDDAREKIVRAEVHLRAFESELAAYRSSDPYDPPTIERHGQIVTAHAAKVRFHRVAFPISKNGAIPNGTSAWKQLVEFGVPSNPVLNLIESVQPYQAGYKPLGYIDALANQDKHRLLALTVTHVNTSDMGIVISGNEVIRAVGIVQSLSQALDASGPRLTEECAEDVQADGQVTVFVAFQNPPVPMPVAPVERLLREMLKCVERIYDQFAALP